MKLQDMPTSSTASRALGMSQPSRLKDATGAAVGPVTLRHRASAGTSSFVAAIWNASSNASLGIQASHQAYAQWRRPSRWASNAGTMVPLRPSSWKKIASTFLPPFGGAAVLATWERAVLRLVSEMPIMSSPYVMAGVAAVFQPSMRPTVARRTIITMTYVTGWQVVSRES